MAFDGTMVSALCAELTNTIQGDRIYKIAQPEPYEIILTIKGGCGQKRLLISANPTLPLLYFTDTNKPSPMNAPNFCMVLRKHISNGRIVSVAQPSLERIIILEVEHLNELGDVCRKKLICELMGKYSNVIFCDEDGTVIDSLKHVSSNVSGLREVLPGRKYFLPEEIKKQDPFEATRESFMTDIFKKPTSVSKSLCGCFAGMSMVMASELCYEAGIDSDGATASISEDKRERLFDAFEAYRKALLEKSFSPVCIYEKDEKTPHEFSALPLHMYGDLPMRPYETVSELLENYFREKNLSTNMKQRSSDLRKIVVNLIERTSKKLDLQLRQMRDTEKKENWKINGELLLAYQHSVPEGAKEFTCDNYYTGEKTTIPLDPQKSALENANRLFDKYQKAKRTEEALALQLEETKNTLYHLQTIEVSILTSKSEADLAQIKEEMAEAGFIKRKGPRGKKQEKTKPLHYISSDGYHIYVGKNNYQNEEITFKMATGNDWWFHAKKIPGSHVIVKTNNEEIPDRTFNEAAALAAHYSKAAMDGGKVEVDYVRKKEIKKTPGTPAGFVIYYTNYSMMADCDISGIEEVKQ